MGERTMLDFERDLAAGKEYEDFVQRVLWDRGIVCLLNRSAKYQWRHGESLGGIEIKLDRRFRETGNLYIETAERRTTNGDSAWRPSGIYDVPRPRLYAIGDQRTIYLLSVTLLHNVRANCEQHDGDTMRGFKLPLAKAAKWAVEVMDLESDTAAAVVRD